MPRVSHNTLHAIDTSVNMCDMVPRVLYDATCVSQHTARNRHLSQHVLYGATCVTQLHAIDNTSVNMCYMVPRVLYDATCVIWCHVCYMVPRVSHNTLHAVDNTSVNMCQIVPRVSYGATCVSQHTACWSSIEESDPKRLTISARPSFMCSLNTRATSKRLLLGI